VTLVTFFNIEISKFNIINELYEEDLVYSYVAREFIFELNI